LLPLPTALPGNRNRNGNGSAAAEAEVGRRDPAMLAVSEPPVLGAYPLGVRPPPPPCATGCCFVCAPTGSGVGHPHLAGADRRWGAVRHGGGDHHAAHRQVRRPAQYRMHRQPVTDAAQQTAAQRVDAPALAVAARTHTRARIRAHAPAGGAHRRARTAVVGAEERNPPASPRRSIGPRPVGSVRAFLPRACRVQARKRRGDDAADHAVGKGRALRAGIGLSACGPSHS
jgi:hypothetical protein